MLQHEQPETSHVIQNNEVVLEIVGNTEKDQTIKDSSKLNPGYSEVETGPTPKDYGSEVISQEDFVNEQKN
jgi:hypothetical protein